MCNGVVVWVCMNILTEKKVYSSSVAIKTRPLFPFPTPQRHAMNSVEPSSLVNIENMQDTDIKTRLDAKHFQTACQILRQMEKHAGQKGLSWKIMSRRWMIRVERSKVSKDKLHPKVIRMVFKQLFNILQDELYATDADDATEDEFEEEGSDLEL